MSVSEVNEEGIHLFTAILRDVTQEKEAQAMLHQEQRRTSAIMNSALNAIITTDATGRLELINPSAGRVFGLHPRESMGTSLGNLVVKEDGTRPLEGEITSFLQQAAGTVQELLGQRLDGTRFPMRMSVSEVKEEGIHLFTAILRDVTQEKEAQARLEASQEIIRLERSKLAALLDSTVWLLCTSIIGFIIPHCIYRYIVFYQGYLHCLTG
jgi:PAS domain S-box-containing protein